MTEVCTTPSRTNTTIKPAPSKPRRRKVAHLFWVPAMTAAAEMGVQCRALCGRWEFVSKPKRKNYLDSVGNLIPLPEPRDCKNCIRSWVAEARRCSDGDLS